MRILILGGTGSTGRALIGDLRGREEPLDITVISRSTRELPGATKVLTGHYAQLVPSASFKDQLWSVDAVVHLADGLADLQSRMLANDTSLANQLIAGSRDVAIAARDAGVPRFIHVSSIKAICGEDDTRVLTETSAPKPSSLYGRSKLRLEQTLHQVFEQSAARLVILRNPVMYAEDKAGSIHRLLMLADTPWPLPFGGLHNKRSLLAVRNFASALAAVVRAGPDAPAGVFHVHDGPPLSTTQLVRTLRSALGRPARLFPAGPAARLACQLPVLGPLARRLYGSLEMSDARLRQGFGWSPVIETRVGLADVARRYSR
jgi:nucleoside-diphosphate-sugar epimerase